MGCGSGPIPGAEPTPSGNLRNVLYARSGPDRDEHNLELSTLMSEPRACRLDQIRTRWRATGIVCHQASRQKPLIAELTKSMRVWQTSLEETQLQVGEERAHLFLVADGMGGHQAGERPRGRRDRAVHLSHSDGFLGPTVRMRRESLRSSKQRFVTPMPAFLKKPRSTRN